jgi:hypothetical protein
LNLTVTIHAAGLALVIAASAIAGAAVARLGDARDGRYHITKQGSLPVRIDRESGETEVLTPGPGGLHWMPAEEPPRPHTVTHAEVAETRAPHEGPSSYGRIKLDNGEWFLAGDGYQQIAPNIPAGTPVTLRHFIRKTELVIDSTGEAVQVVPHKEYGETD